MWRLLSILVVVSLLFIPSAASAGSSGDVFFENLPEGQWSDLKDLEFCRGIFQSQELKVEGFYVSPAEKAVIIYDVRPEAKTAPMLEELPGGVYVRLFRGVICVGPPSWVDSFVQRNYSIATRIHRGVTDVGPEGKRLELEDLPAGQVSTLVDLAGGEVPAAQLWAFHHNDELLNVIAVLVRKAAAIPTEVSAEVAEAQPPAPPKEQPSGCMTPEQAIEFIGGSSWRILPETNNEGLKYGPGAPAVKLTAPKRGRIDTPSGPLRDGQQAIAGEATYWCKG